MSSEPWAVSCFQSHLNRSASCIRCGLVGTVRHIGLETVKASVCLGSVLPSTSEVSKHLRCREAQLLASSCANDSLAIGLSSSAGKQRNQWHHGRPVDKEGGREGGLASFHSPLGKGGCWRSNRFTMRPRALAASQILHTLSSNSYSGPPP